MLWAVIGCQDRHPRAGAGQGSQRLDFNQDVQPILASNCFSCHGPDPEMRKAGLRLDLEESAFKKRPGHPDAIVPGHPEKSELIKRIESKDPHYLMPQSAQGEAKPMKPADIAILREWIKEGAVYRPHWAFEKPVRPPLPTAVRNDGWVKTPIDMFVLARMQKEGLRPSPEADKDTLIRRVTLDLTGLLPTPAEVKRLPTIHRHRPMSTWWTGCCASQSYGERGRATGWITRAMPIPTGCTTTTAGNLAVSRLPDSVIQQQQAVRSVCHGADCGRPAAGEEPGSADRERICPAGREQQRRRHHP